MRRLFTLYFLLSLGFILAQSNDQNWIKTTEYLTATATTDSAKITVQYFDGLGRPSQVVAHRQTPDKKDIITHIDYDEFGRQTREYLPYAPNRSSLYFEDNALSQTLEYYQTHYATQVAFSEKEIENSPLNRVMKQAAPGDDWALGSGHEIAFDYQTNDNGEVYIFTADTNYDSAHKIYNIGLNTHGGASYTSGQLYKTITQDENGQHIEEFKNKEEQVILKRTYESNEKHDTYYVYDIYGNLTYVLPPKVNHGAAMTTVVLDGLCYQYKYDDRNRLVEKKLPGKAWEYMVYDKQDRLVATQDGNLRSTNPYRNPFHLPVGTWLFTKYDKYGRVVYTGFYSNGGSRSMIQDLVNERGSNNETRGGQFTLNGITVNYTKNGAFPLENNSCQLLSLNYYDDYNFSGAVAPPAQVLGQNTIDATGTEETQHVTTKGLGTASFVRILGTDNWEKTLTYYDTKARPVRSYKINHLGGHTIVDSRLDFRGKVLSTTTQHQRTNKDKEIEVTENFTYDHAERLLKHTHQVNNEAERLLAKNEYDDLGQLKAKKVGGMDTSGSTALQTIDYKYNIRGWLTDINDVERLGTDLFAFEIKYNKNLNTPQAGVKELYNGNIAETHWRTKNDNQQRGYAYAYDDLNRLKRAHYYKGTTFKGNFNEHIWYDKNGNITHLNRWSVPDWSTAPAAPNIDDLAYVYPVHSNQLLKVTDATSSLQGFDNGDSGTGNDYLYDANGNMTQDKNKNITNIEYNFLNLPTKILWQNGTYITYTYNATGQKIEKQVKETKNKTTTTYLDGYQYKDGLLQFFPMAEGYVNVLNKEEDDGGSFKHLFDYVYNYTDHLGNIRLSYTDANRDGKIANYIDFSNGYQQVKEILEENNYYPFGLKHKNYNSLISKYALTTSSRKPVSALNSETGYKYKYNGKELQDELGLNWYDYGARFYMPDIGRWGKIDNASETYYALTPYNYAGNTPIQAIDIDGNLFIFVNGYMAKQWLAGQQNPTMSVSDPELGYYETSNPLYSKYAPDRGFYRDGARNNGQSFRYWSFDQSGKKGKGVNNLYMAAYHDNNAYYTNGSYTPRSTAQARFKGGQAAAKELIRKLESGEISLAEGETIKIVGHSQGAAHAAGLATELLKHSVYGSRVEFVDYIAAHQPKNFESPKGLQSRQFLTWSDWVAGSGALSTLGLNGGSENGCIKNVATCKERSSYRGGRGGHSVNTYLNYLIGYFRSLGINVTVKE